MLTFLALTYLLLAIGSWNQKQPWVVPSANQNKSNKTAFFFSVNSAGGAFGIMTGLIAFYIVVGMLMDDEPTALFRLPMGVLSDK